jgi:glycosyltransferase involved in cell wall biosynthesis
MTGGKAMSKKKVKKKNAGPPKPMIRLSQCMIVKNEEKNIEKALNWAKPVAFEQIVVDTGSTDRTVEVAEKMGAKVYHFEWIDDFSAAKNYAIEQATGNWIAFLDADEFFSPEDAEKLIVMLEEFESDPERSNGGLVLTLPWLQLNDQNKPFAEYRVDRIFTNIPEIRYVGIIHESLTVFGENASSKEISVMHTGYSDSAYRETAKAMRNIKLLRKELVDYPDNIALKAYLADALVAEGSENSIIEAEELYTEVLDVETGVPVALKIKTYTYYINKYINSPEMLPECERLCRNAREEFPDNLDIEYFYAGVLNKRGSHSMAWEILQRCETFLQKPAGNSRGVNISQNPELLYNQMIATAQRLGDVESIITYAAKLLFIDKTQDETLGKYIATLLQYDTSEEEVLEVLAKIYDANDPTDLMCIARAAMNCGAISLAQRVMGIAGGLMNRGWKV